MTAEYLTKAELAQLLRVTPRTVTNYQRRADFPKPLRVGKRNLWARATLIAYVQGQVGEAGATTPGACGQLGPTTNGAPDALAL